MNVEIGRQYIIILYWKEQGRAVSILGIHKSEPDIDIGFSTALILLCISFLAGIWSHNWPSYLAKYRSCNDITKILEVTVWIIKRFLLCEEIANIQKEIIWKRLSSYMNCSRCTNVGSEGKKSHASKLLGRFKERLPSWVLTHRRRLSQCTPFRFSTP